MNKCHYFSSIYTRLFIFTNQTQRIIKGSRSAAESKLAAMPNKDVSDKRWHIFVGKCDKDTDEECIKVFLEENEIEVAEIRKLKANNEWQEKSNHQRKVLRFECL